MLDTKVSKPDATLLFRYKDNVPPNIGWVRTAIALGIVGYTCLFIYGLFFERLLEGMRIQEGATALAMVMAYFLSKKHPVEATVLTLGIVIWEALLSFFIAGTLMISSLGAFPVLVISSGMLLGPEGAIGMAVICGVGVPIAVYLSGVWGYDLSSFTSATQGNALIVTEIIITIACLLTNAVLRSYKTAHDASEKLRRRYMDLFQNAPDGLVALDEDFRVVEANPAGARILGSTPATVIGVPFAEAIGRAGAQGQVDVHAAKPGAPLSVTLSGPDQKERIIEISSRSETAPEAETLLILRDVTLRRALEDRLGHAQRLESVGRLAGGVAHDFNNLLTVVNGNASVLVGHADPEVSSLAKDIEEAGARGATLTRQLLAFARRDIHRPTVVDLCLAASGMRRLLERLLGEQHKLEMYHDASAPVMADLTQLEQIALNLVSNARDAMPGGGVVRIEIRALGHSDAISLGSTLEAPRQALLEVTDTGIGMSAEVKRRLFEPFFTTKPRGRGTGLGLASVHGIVAQNNGAISVDSELGRGTRFRVFLPLVQEQAGVEVQVRRNPAKSSSGNEHVLLVEDEESVRALGYRILNKSGYRVTEAADADQALVLARKNTDIALLVTDIHMPGMSGPQLAARIRDHLPKMRVLFMSGRYDGDDDVQSGVRRNLLKKPFSSEEMLVRVREELDREW